MSTDISVVARVAHVASWWLEIQSHVLAEVIVVCGVCDAISRPASDDGMELKEAPVECHKVPLCVRKITELLLDYGIV